MRSSAAAVALAALASACMVLPPSRAELSGFVHGGAAGTRVAAGAHAASAPKRLDVPVDLGAGYVYERPRTTGAPSDAPGQHGNYIELTRQVWRRGKLRAHAGGRVEVFWNDVGDAGTRRAATARLSIERVVGHVSGATGDRNGGAAAYGLVAPGLFLEAGTRELATGKLTGAVLVGVSLRLPLLFAVSKPTLL